MLRLVFFVIVLFPFAIASAQDAEVVNQIRAKAAADWPDDNATQQSQIETETKAAIAVEAYRAEYGENELLSPVFKQAAEDWPDDYAIMQYQIEEEALELGIELKHETSMEAAKPALENKGPTKSETELQAANELLAKQIEDLKKQLASHQSTIAKLEQQQSAAAAENFRLKFFPLKVWTASNGVSTTIGTMVKCGKSTVDIKIPDGEKIRVQIAQLSEDDREFLKEYRKTPVPELFEKKQ